MSYRMTLSEAESYLRKAARACGLDWGIAEEAGKAARWLAAFGLPGAEVMLAHLENLASEDYRVYIPDCGLQPWQSGGGLICPVIGGAALADRAAQMVDGPPIRLGATAYPLLLGATLSQAAYGYDTAFTLCWKGVRMDCFADGLSISGQRDRLLVAETDHVCCCHEEPAEPQLRPSAQSFAIDEEIFRRIDKLAFKTYVPASEASRAGAGAGLTDND